VRAAPPDPPSQPGARRDGARRFQFTDSFEGAGRVAKRTWVPWRAQHAPQPGTPSTTRRCSTVNSHLRDRNSWQSRDRTRKNARRPDDAYCADSLPPQPTRERPRDNAARISFSALRRSCDGERSASARYAPAHKWRLTRPAMAAIRPGSCGGRNGYGDAWRLAAQGVKGSSPPRAQGRDQAATARGPRGGKAQ